MTEDDYRELLQRAARAKYGIKVALANHRIARRLRRRLYHVRDLARKAKDDSFDGLSMIIWPDGQLWIVKREVLPQYDDGRAYDGTTQSLEPDELPDRITPRGPHRSPWASFHYNPLNSDIPR